MAIIKRENGKYQVKVRGADRRWISKTLGSKREAESYEANIKSQTHKGLFLTNSSLKLTLDEYFINWCETSRERVSPGWRKAQIRLYRDHISPMLGRKKLQSITPQSIATLLNHLAKKDLSEQTRQHAYNLLRKMFREAIELFQLLTFNPVLPTLKPKVPVREANHLNLEQAQRLLAHCYDKLYGLGIAIQLMVGLRVGEVQALKWSNIDLDQGVLYVRSAFIRNEGILRDYPKSRRQRSHVIPWELLQFLKASKEKCLGSEFVVTSLKGEMLKYEHYEKKLKAYCVELELPMVTSHGLRHSTAAIYLSHNATKDDIRELLAHSSEAVTQRYIHHQGTNLEAVAKVIRMFPNVPKESKTC